MGSEWQSETSFQELIEAGLLEIGDGYRAKNSSTLKFGLDVRFVTSWTVVVDLDGSGCLG